jgi:uncharacterized protein YkwD
MKLNARLFVAWLLSCLLALPLLGMSREASAAAKPTKTPKSIAAGGNAYDVIAAVNQIRSANGLPAFQVNGALMAAAQGQSNYMASSGSITHTGPGGSDVHSRAVAAGYGAGAAISAIENIYGGLNASPQNAVSWWQSDGLHLATILSTRHTDVGAGVATNNGVVYYTLDVGVISGSAPPSSGGTGGTTGAGTTPAASAAPAATALAYNPVVKAKAGPDGSIVHTVQAGQTLWTIAATYNVSLADLYRLNGFTDQTLIRPGQKIIVRTATAAGGASDATAEATSAGDQAAVASATPSPYPTVDRPSTATAAALALAQSAPQNTPAAARPAASLTRRLVGLHIDPVLVLIAGLLLAGADPGTSRPFGGRRPAGRGRNTGRRCAHRLCALDNNLAPLPRTRAARRPRHAAAAYCGPCARAGGSHATRSAVRRWRASGLASRNAAADRAFSPAKGPGRRRLPPAHR